MTDRVSSSSDLILRNQGRTPGCALVPYTGVGVLETLIEAVNYNRFLSDMIHAHLRPGIKVLDFGAGVGTFALPLMNSGVDVTCVEPDGALHSRLIAAGASTVTALDEIDDASVDFIYTLNVLEHIRDDAATVRSLAGKLKSGGTLMVYVPAFQILFSSFDAKIGHLRRYGRSSLRRLATAAGLRIDALRYVDSLGFFAALLYRALARDEGKLGTGTVRLYDKFVFPVSRRLDTFVSPCIGKNLMLIAAKQ